MADPKKNAGTAASPAANGGSPAPAASSQGSAAPLAVGEGGDAASSPAASPSPGSSGESVSAPRKSRSTGIPGVHPDAAGDEELGGEAHEEETGVRRVLRENEEAQPPEITPPDKGSGKEGEGKDGGTTTPPPTPKFKLKDLEFESEDAAVHLVKTLKGQAAAVSAKAREVHAQEQAVIAALSEAGFVLQGGKVVRAIGSAPPPSPSATPQAPPNGATPAAGHSAADLSTEEGVRTFLDSALNWKQLPQIIEFYEKQHGQTLGPAIAMRLMMETILPEIWKKVDGHVGEKIQPLRQHQTSQQAARAVNDLFMGMKDYTFQDGSPAYPELATQEGIDEVYQIWLDLGNSGVMTPKALMSQQGVQMAISLLKDFKAMQGRVNPNPASPAVVPPSNHPPANPENTGAASEAVQRVMRSIDAARGSMSPDLASGEGVPLRTGNANESAADAFKRALRGAGGKQVIPGVKFS